MAKILSMNKEGKSEDLLPLDVYGYLTEFSRIQGSAGAAQWLFTVLSNVFLDVCNDVGLCESDFALNKESADRLFELTMNWIFPTIDEVEKPDAYKLVWELETPNYKYTIIPFVPVDTPRKSNDAKGYAIVEREFANGDIEYWDRKARRWKSKISNISDNSGLTK